MTASVELVAGPNTREAPSAKRTGFHRLTSRYVTLDLDDVDTDQVIPARFLTTTQRTGLGRFAFHDRRYDADGTPKRGFPLDAPDAAGAEVLVVGRNFGCGSSREHAVWALADSGFRAVIGTSFADIFRANAHANGLLPVALPEDAVRALMRRRADDARALVTVDLEARVVTLPSGEPVGFDVPPFARHCIMHGVDELEFLLDAEPERAAYEAARRVALDTRAVARATEAES
jgi:3-isopropylmalate/(R)-2-methylmalate dehydratase small subunit